MKISHEENEAAKAILAKLTPYQRTALVKFIAIPAIEARLSGLQADYKALNRLFAELKERSNSDYEKTAASIDELKLHHRRELLDAAKKIERLETEIFDLKRAARKADESKLAGLPA